MDIIEYEVGYVYMVIDMLLMVVCLFDLQQFCLLYVCVVLCEVVLCYFYVLCGEQECVYLYGEDDFIVFGSELLLIYVIFNLLCNVLFYIGCVGKGEIDICFEYIVNCGLICVCDSGLGILLDVLLCIFNCFYFYSEDCGGVVGLGIGLVFLCEVVECMDGVISCCLCWGEYIEFLIFFFVCGMDECV